jgi:hypothetical protein
MKFRPFAFFLIAFCQTLQAQNRFEGIIKFKTEISVTDAAREGSLEQLENKYGDSLLVYYSLQGDILREYLNTGPVGNNFQLYRKGSKNLIITKKGSSRKDTLDVSNNTLKLIKMTKSKKDTILGLDCKCYSFKAFDDYDNRILTYCYSKKIPKIKPKHYKRYRDYFVSKFYKLSKRPYLKFSINAPEFNLTFTAVRLLEMKLDPIMFVK